MRLTPGGGAPGTGPEKVSGYYRARGGPAQDTEADFRAKGEGENHGWTRMDADGRGREEARRRGKAGRERAGRMSGPVSGAALAEGATSKAAPSTEAATRRALDI